MSKQDGYSSRTATDVERKYNFGKTFAEVYNLISDAQKAAKEAQNAFDGLTKDEIFNLLTDFGKSQGVYRDDDENVYMNASYIKSGKLAAEYIDAENLNVAAANITGQLVATQIDATDLQVLAANITGKLTAGQIDATDLQVSAANVTGKLTAAQIDATNLQVAAANVTGTLTASQIDTTNLNVAAANITGRLTFGQLPSNVASTDDIKDVATEAAETYIDRWCVASPTIAGGVFKDYEQEISLHLDSTVAGSHYGMILEDDAGEIFSIWSDSWSPETAGIILRENTLITLNDGKFMAWGTWDFTNANVVGL